jgi:UDP-hydrolysing UDP-N-acetyl-D-glucosamine 2-epimerase
MARARETPRRVLVVTGSRAEFGLLRPVMNAVKRHKRLRLSVAVAGEHLLRPALTWREVAAEFRIDAKVPMQRAGDRGRLDHAAACGRGVAGFAAAYRRLKPDWVVVLGDRIEAFSAAAAASVGGIAVCHIHGGDRAEGVADEAMRHAIMKLAHVHCPATEQSAARIRKMGEWAEHVFLTGSPAIDGLKAIKPMSDREAAKYGDPSCVVLLHPSGLDEQSEGRLASGVMMAVAVEWSERSQGVLCLAPNHDPGREVIAHEIGECGLMLGWSAAEHLPRSKWLALLKRLAQRGGFVIGNSSAGLIECAAVRVPVVNVGPRQAGRERAGNVVDVSDIGDGMVDAICKAIARIPRLRPPAMHPFGNGRAGERIAGVLAKVNPRDPGILRKRNRF